MSGTSSKASNVGLDSENGLEGSGRSTHPELESGQEVVNEGGKPRLAKESEGGKREVNIPHRSFRTNFAHSFDTGDNPRRVARVYRNHDSGNEQEGLKTSQLTSNGSDSNPAEMLPQSEASFYSQDSDKYSDISSFNSEEKELVSNQWADGKEDFTPSDTHIKEELRSDVASVVEDLPQDTSLLSAIEVYLDDFPAEGLRQTLGRSALTRLKVERMRELTTFFQSFTEIVQSGSREDLREYVISPLFRYLAKGRWQVTMWFRIDELDYRCPQNQDTGLISQSQSGSLTPLGVLVDKTKTFEWVLCRQMGFLKPKDIKSLHTLYLTEFHYTDADVPWQMFRRRAAYNIRGRWYSIRAFRMAILKFLGVLRSLPQDVFPNPPIPPPKLGPDPNRLLLIYKKLVVNQKITVYIGATAWAEKCLQDQKLLKTAGKKLFGKLLPIEETEKELEENCELFFRTWARSQLFSTEDGENPLPENWQEIHDSLGQMCWLYASYSLTYKLPKKDLDYCTVMDRRKLKLSNFLKGSQPPNKTDQASSSKSKLNPTGTKKSPTGTNPSQEPGLVSESSNSPEPDEFDNSLVSLSDLPQIETMLCYYFSDEEWFSRQDYSEQLSLSPNVSTRAASDPVD
ncbi:hypothetical protein IFR05_004271 [Cadophora sp. M221]|nr:hypothetical protein IFR05_004271 [Cadophora sp. M221]